MSSRWLFGYSQEARGMVKGRSTSPVLKFWCFKKSCFRITREQQKGRVRHHHIFKVLAAALISIANVPCSDWSNDVVAIAFFSELSAMLRPKRLTNEASLKLREAPRIESFSYLPIDKSSWNKTRRRIFGSFIAAEAKKVVEAETDSGSFGPEGRERLLLRQTRE